MRNRDLERTLAALESVKSLKLKSKVSYAVVYNKRKVEQAYRDFQEARDQILLSHAKKDKKGNPELDERGNLKFDNFQEVANELQDLLNAEVDIKPRKVKFEDLPEDLTPEQMEGLFFMIEEEE